MIFMVSKLNRSKMSFCYGKLTDKNFYDDKYILGLSKACDYCNLDQICNYYDKEGNDNRRCFRFFSNGTSFECILYCTIETHAQSRIRNTLFHSITI